MFIRALFGKLKYPIGLVLCLLSGQYLYSIKNDPQAINAIVTPVPEFAPTDMVLISEYALAKESGLRIAEIVLGSKKKLGVLVNDTNGSLDEILPQDLKDHESIILIPFAHESIWVRDFMGIQVDRPTLQEPSRHLIDFQYRDEFVLEDRGSHQLALTIPHSVIQIPLEMDGGNFLTNGHDCFIGEESIHKFQSSDKRNLFHRALKTEIGCKNIIVFEDPPHEHVDMYLKVLNKNQVLVGQIPPDLLKLSLSLNLETQEYLHSLKKKLDKIADSLDKQFSVTRIAIPITGMEHFKTFLNGTLIDRTLVLPRYSFPSYLLELGFTSELMTQLEQETELALAPLGFEVKWVNSMDLLNGGGALHCITFQIHSQQLPN